MTLASSVARIAASVSSGEASAERIALEAVRRAEEYDRVQPGVWISRRSADEVLASARAIDERVATGERLPLAGVPFAVKDNIDVAGLETTAACPAFSYLPSRSARVVERLQESGAILLGKSNLDQFATGLTGTRSPYGALGCVYNREYVSGGSSSGSAVAVAAGIVPLALGTDTAGSGRIPAAFNHLVGFKPTRGRWSTSGLVPACRSLDCISSLTTTAQDARLVDAVVSGFDAADPYSRRPCASPRVGSGFRLGLPRPEQLELAGDERAAGLFGEAIERLLAVGGIAAEIDIAPLLRASELLYSGPWVAERAVALEAILDSSPDAIHPVVRAIVQAARGIAATDAFRGLYALQQYARAAEAIWERVDALLLPTAATIYRISEVLAEPFALNSALGRYTNFVNLLDMSAIAVPAGFRGNATPFGVTLIGPAWADDALLSIAARLETECPSFAPPPIDAAPVARKVELAVVGAHLSGMPLNWQLTSRGARLIGRTHSAPTYRLYAMSGTTPPKPALVHSTQGAAIELEVYELEAAAFGSFVAEVPPPLAIGTVILEGGRTVRGFVAEPRALEGAEDITADGGWRAYLARRARQR
jgi:allophanate hydrolase